jgi:hypothetical protein
VPIARVAPVRTRVAPIAAMQKEISQAALAKFASLCGGTRASIVTLIVPAQT